MRPVMTLRRLFRPLLLAGAAAAFAAPAHAGPTLGETVDFTRSELIELCNDARRTRIDAIDRLSVGGGRSCQVTLSPGKFQLAVRQRGAHKTVGAYARLKLDVAFDRNSGFLCGPEDNKGRSTLFIACDIARGANGPACAERSVSVARTDGDDYKAKQHLPAASILRVDGEACGVVARALTFISERTSPSKNSKVRDFFAR